MAIFDIFFKKTEKKESIYLPAYHIDNIPDGRYIVKLSDERVIGNAVHVYFEIVVGKYEGKKISQVLSSRKAVNAINERSLGWVEYMAFDEDAKASKIYEANINSIAGMFYVDVRDLYVIGAITPIRSEATFNKFMRELSTKWTVENEQDLVGNFTRSKYFYEVNGLLPRTNGYLLGEDALRRWLDKASNPEHHLFSEDVCKWMNEIYVSIGGDYRKLSREDTPKILINNGFEEPPFKLP